MREEKKEKSITQWHFHIVKHRANKLCEDVWPKYLHFQNWKYTYN